MKKKTTYDLRPARMDYLFDTHAHYDDEAFDADREEVLAGLKEQGVGTVVNVGASIASTKTTLALAETNVLFPRDFTNFIWLFFLPCRICPLIFLLFLCVHCFIF